MKKHLVILFVSLFLVLVYSNFKSISTLEPKSKIAKLYRENLSNFINEINTFNSLIETYEPTKKNQLKLQNQFKKIRFAYKKIECFSAYFDSFSTDLLNGPNLPHIEYEQNEPTKQNDPTGMQVLEEILFSTEQIPTKLTLKNTLQGFEFGLKNLQSTSSKYNFDDNIVFDAFRHQLLRIMALGISGFDSPIAQISINEASASLSAIKEYTQVFKNNEKFTHSLTLSIEFLNSNKNFVSFDRSVFIRSHLNKLFVSINELELSLGIIPFDKDSKINKIFTPFNSDAKSLFDSKLIKPYYFHPQQILKPKEGLLELGELLFVDPILSGNNKRACVSCHQPEKAFTDGLSTPMAINKKFNLPRNTPTLMYAGLQQKFQLDARAFHIEDQFAHVIFNENEMASNSFSISQKINSSPAYLEMFQKSFGLKSNQQITHELIFGALAVYLRSLNTFDSPFDKYMRGEVQIIDKSVLKGFNLFMGKAKCGSCHFAPVFNGTLPPDFKNTESEVIGVTKNTDFKNPEIDPDLGRYEMASIKEHKHSFKTPTLRNISITAPYMHNGAFKTLEEVIDFYNKGGGKGMGLDLPNQTLPADKLNLTKNEQKDLVTFLKSLTDSKPISINRKLPISTIDSLNSRKVGGEY